MRRRWLAFGAALSDHTAWEQLARARALLADAGYDAASVSRRLLGRPLWSPTTLVKRGSCNMQPPKLADELDALIAMYALGVEVPTSSVGSSLLIALEEARLAEMRRGAARAPVALSPVGSSLLLATDFAPPCATSPQPCYYVGPDSVALAYVVATVSAGRTVCDLCAGSGVQALVALAAGAKRATAVEASERAAGFCRLNAALNMRAIAAGREVSVPVEPYDLIVANPPFVAVPSDVSYETFADGGETGEDVLADVVAFAADHLAPGGLLTIVCEVNGQPGLLAERLRRWWTAPDDVCIAVVRETLTARADPDAVAARRAPGPAGIKWMDNFRTHDIDAVANGFVFLSRRRRRRPPSSQTAVLHAPRLWAPPPTNVQARLAVAKALDFVLYE